jgi:hypothetical protein
VEDVPDAGDEAELDLDEIDNEGVDKEGGA